MREHKLVFYAIGAFVALFAAVTAIVVFKNEIADFFLTLKEKFDDRRSRSRCTGEFSDYADV